MLVTGQVGEIDGVKIIKTPKAWLTDGTDSFQCLIVHPSAIVAPVKTNTVRIFDKPEDAFGTKVDGRIYYDCFILESKKLGLASIQNVTA